jgi:hypothetical protein
MNDERINRNIVAFAAVSLCAYCAALVAVSGDLGFEGDDWWVFSWPYWNPFPMSLWYFARDCLRPIEGVYWISLFEIFGFNRVAFHIASLLLAVGGCTLMAMCLATAFPGRTTLAVSALMFAFFLPTVSSLTYVLATDNSRLSLLFFWACVLAFQRWAAGRAAWSGLLGPWFLYALAFCTYEAPSFLIFSVPFFVLPVWHRRRVTLSFSSFVLRLAVGILGSFASVIAIRFLVLQGGAVSQKSLLPSWDLLWAYPALLPFYLVAPFVEAASEPVSVVAGVIVALIAGSLLILSFRGEQVSLPATHTVSRCPTLSRPSNEDPEFQDSSPAEDGLPLSSGTHASFYDRGWYILGLGLCVLLLGFLPYQFAGYGAGIPALAETALMKWHVIPDGFHHWFNFNWSSRIYSAASYGLAILLAWAISCWTSRRAKVVAGLVAAVCIGFMASFHAGLSKDWQAAADVRNQLIASLVSQVPDVTPGTNFLFIDLESSWGRAPVFRGWNGLRELVRMVYSRNDLGAWYLFPYQWKPPNRLFHQAVVTPEGFASRAMKTKQPAAHDSLLVFRRSGSRLNLVDRISDGDYVVPTGIRWDGIDSLRSNPSRIRGWYDVTDHTQKPTRNAWQSGFIDTIGISRISLSGTTRHSWGSGEFSGRLTRALPDK